MPLKRLMCATLAALFCLVSGFSTWAQQQFPELIPTPLAAQLSTMREPLPVEMLIDAALSFSGSAGADFSAARERIVANLQRFQADTAEITSQAEIAEKALSFLHSSLLKSYSVLQTRVDTAVETGAFNCVSSAVLYMILARAAGLSVGGIRATDHAFCTVWVNGVQVDVETTNPYGYNPGAKKEFLDTFGKVTGYAYIPPSAYAERKSIGEKDLLGLILYNRVSEYTASRYFRDALQPAVSAYVLAGNEETRQLITTAFANYVSWLATREEFGQAFRFIELVKASFGTAIDLDRRKAEVLHNWLVSLLEVGSLEEARLLLEQPSARDSLGEADWADLSAYAIQLAAQDAARKEAYLAAADILSDGIRRVGPRADLLQAYEAYMHNAFAQLFDARRFSEARAVAEQGLAQYPESRVLVQDLAMLKRTKR